MAPQIKVQTFFWRSCFYLVLFGQVSCYRLLRGNLHFRIVPREHWVINNRDYSRFARNYNKENQTRPFGSTLKLSYIHKSLFFSYTFIDITLSSAPIII